jgi:hypothetical protein
VTRRHAERIGWCARATTEGATPHPPQLNGWYTVRGCSEGHSDESPLCPRGQIPGTGVDRRAALPHDLVDLLWLGSGAAGRGPSKAGDLAGRIRTPRPAPGGADGTPAGASRCPPSPPLLRRTWARKAGRPRRRSRLLGRSAARPGIGAPRRRARRDRRPDDPRGRDPYSLPPDTWAELTVPLRAVAGLIRVTIRAEPLRVPRDCVPGSADGRGLGLAIKRLWLAR